jgi:hypothetical protein
MPEPTLMLIGVDGQRFKRHHEVAILKSSSDCSMPEPTLMLLLLLVVKDGQRFKRHHEVAILRSSSDCSVPEQADVNASSPPPGPLFLSPAPSSSSTLSPRDR